MKKIFKILKEITEFSSPSGYEISLAQKIKEMIKHHLDLVKIDEMGNLIGIKKGRGNKKILFTAHLDEVYMYIKKISDSFALIETHGIDKKILLSQEVSVIKENGKKFNGIIGMIPPHLKEETKNLETFVDFGESAEKLGIKIGDIITFKNKLEILERTRCSCKSLDNRAGVSLLILLIEKLKNFNYHKNLIFLFNAQEETGGTGALVKGVEIYPDESIIIDTTFAKSFYTKNEIQDIELGKGPAIGIGPFIDKKIKNKLLRICKKYKIPYQIEVLPSKTGTDLDRLSLIKEGIPCGLISIPLRYMHTPNEMVDVRDIEWGVEILKKYIEEEK